MGWGVGRCGARGGVGARAGAARRRAGETESAETRAGCSREEPWCVLGRLGG